MLPAMFRHAVMIGLLASTACLAQTRSPNDAGRPVPVDTGTTQPDTGIAPRDASTISSPDAEASDTGFADAQVPTGQPLFVMVGDGGSWASSTDGGTWNQQAPGQVYEDLLRDVTYGDGTFFAVGGGGTTSVVLVSTNGTTWVPKSSPPGWIGATAWLPTVNAFVIAGSNGLRFRSLDGGDTFVDGGDFIEGHFRDAVYGNGRVVAVGDTYGGQGIRGLSGATTDGRAWTTNVTGSHPFWSVAYGDGPQVFVAGGESGRVSWSTDGITWNDQTIGTTTVRVAYGAGRFIALTSNGAQESTDGQTWTPIGNVPVFRLLYGDGRWVGVSEPGETYTSSDGRQWTRSSGNGVPNVAGVFGWVNP